MDQNSKLTEERILIEEIRRRAKDSKAKSAGEFIMLSEKYLELTRNYAFLISLGFIGYVGGLKQDLSKVNITFVTLSLVAGLISISSSYQYAQANANYYCDLERNLSIAFPSKQQYDEMMTNEEKIRLAHKNRHNVQLIAILSLLSQLIFLIIFIISILT